MPLPKVVLPRAEVLSVSPPAGLTEIAMSFGQTLSNIAQALPATAPTLPGGQGGQAKIRLPKVEQIFKGPGVALEEIKSSLEATVSGLAPSGSPETKRGTITEEKPAPPLGGVATRGSL